MSGSFDSSQETHSEPTDAQLAALRMLVERLLRKYRLSPEAVVGHNEIHQQTVCPGDLFDVSAFREDLVKKVNGPSGPFCLGHDEGDGSCLPNRGSLR